MTILYVQITQISNTNRIQTEEELRKNTQNPMDYLHFPPTVLGRSQETFGQASTKTFSVVGFRMPHLVIGNLRLKSVQIKFLKDTIRTLPYKKNLSKVSKNNFICCNQIFLIRFSINAIDSLIS